MEQTRCKRANTAIPRLQGSGVVRATETESQRVVTRDCRAETAELVFQGNRVSVLEDGLVLELDSNDDNMTVEMYLMPRNYVL